MWQEPISPVKHFQKPFRWHLWLLCLGSRPGISVKKQNCTYFPIETNKWGMYFLLLITFTTTLFCKLTFFSFLRMENFTIWSSSAASFGILHIIWIVSPLCSCRNNCWYILSKKKKSMQIGHQQLVLQNLYSTDRGVKYKNMSVLSAISVLPLSRLFVVGTEDGFLKICH